MHGFSGSEPLIGEIRALRTFRLDESAMLLPLHGAEAWYDGPNHAHCVPPTGEHSRDGVGHVAPEPDCECGFYAYGSERSASTNRSMRHVQAVVSCWGRVIAGSRGVRAEYARIDAIWLSPSAPRWLPLAVGRRYPSVRVFANREAMLAEYPLSELDCYDGSPPPRHRLAALFSLLVVTGVVALGLLPRHTLESNTALWCAWGTAGVAAAGLLVAALLGVGPGRRTTSLILLAVVAWLAAPLFGLYGWLLRVPVLYSMLQTTGFLNDLRPGHFPIERTRRSGTFLNL